ncbi:hypothetical protein F2Q69_00060557 [Brassica cretica]|uniref:Uncharacterized protein n=1 Tax=Brassica cretica TaxID=69181 RepID=A0A8S9RAN4_BRACR|nr:hypothetical protein F2Q69_00060557 [Brassica cretica]
MLSMAESNGSVSVDVGTIYLGGKSLCFWVYLKTCLNFLGIVETACLMASDDERVATELKKAITEKKLTQSQLAQHTIWFGMRMELFLNHQIIDIDLFGLGKNGELVRKSSGNRSPKSIVEPAKYVEKPAKWGNQKVLLETSTSLVEVGIVLTSQGMLYL